MKLASTLVAVATALTFSTGALAASQLTTSSGQPVGSTYSNTVATSAPAYVEPTPAPVVEHKAPVKKAKKKAKAKKAAAKPAAKPAAATPASAPSESHDTGFGR